MKSVLMVAYDFPPEGNAGAFRPLRFVRHLPALGWRASVISASPPAFERYDQELVKLIPAETEIVRVTSGDLWQRIQAGRARRIQSRSEPVPSPAPGSQVTATGGVEASHSSLRSWLREQVRRVEAWYYHPDMAMPWIAPATAAAVQVIGRNAPEAIWATAGPVASFFVAERASRQTGVPYVLDFRDPWTIAHNDFEARRPGWAVRSDRRALYRLLKGAHGVIFRFQTEAECFWRAYDGALDPLRVHIIPNGYDGAIEQTPIAGSDRCTILYAGTLTEYRYDTLLQAIDQLCRTDPVRAARLRLKVVGEGTERMAHDAVALGVSGIVETSLPVSSAEVADMQRESQALLVLGRQPTMKGYELFAGAKLFGYLKSGRPIIGVLPLDETRKVLRRVGVSTVADVNSPEDILGMLTRVIDAWSAGTLASLVPSSAACSAYSAQRQTAALVRALEGAPAAEPFVPNSVDVPASLSSELDARRSHMWHRDAVLHS